MIAGAALLLGAGPCWGQQVIKGNIRGGKCGAGVPFANVGIVGKGVGTVANEQGAYQLAYSAATANDTVRISSLGFRSRLLPVRALAAQPDVELVAEAVALREVNVKARGLYRRTHTLGSTKSGAGSTLTLDANDLGAEIGTVISLKRKPTRVLNANFTVAFNRAGAMKFRVNLYRLLPNGKPSDQKLLQRDVIVTSSVVQGPITVDLTADQLVLDEDFLLSLEWIGGADAQRVGNQLAFSAGLGYTDNDLYLRAASQDNWERVSTGAVLAGLQPKISFYVTVQD